MTAFAEHEAPAAVALQLFPRDQLLSSLSHEVANHLTAARMHAELMELGQDGRTSSQAVLHTAGRAGALNSCIGALMREGTGMETFNPLGLIHRVQERVATTYNAQFPLVTQSCQGLRTVRGELEECSRALALLAIELQCSVDEPDCEVALAMQMSHSGYTEISLSIASERPPVINPAYPGAGIVLALHIAEAIARHQGGWVALSSTPGTACVSFSLPGA